MKIQRRYIQFHFFARWHIIHHNHLQKGDRQFQLASNVTNFLSSSVSNKGFVPRDYPGEVIWVHGMLFHSIVPGNIRSGICYYDAYQGIYIPGLYTNTRSEEPITIQKLASQLLQGTTYFGYIRNDAGGGAVNNGSITVSTY